MKRINNQINPEFINQAKILSRYTPVVQACLPPDYHAHVRVANIRNNSLVLVTDSPVWTTRLRQLAGTILQALHDNAARLPASAPIHHVQVQTSYFSQQETSGHAENAVNKAPRGISEQAASYLAQSADSIDDPELKKALSRLSRHTRS